MTDAFVPSLDLFVALGALTPLEREVVVDHVMRDESIGSLADRLGCTKQNVHSAYRRGIRKLRDELAQEAA
jgi:DNA-directed RNA polymerase specialized sigma24 family protein